MSQASYSENNVLNSVSIYLATQLVAAGYLVYWHERDAMQTDGGLYVEYSQNYAAYLVDPTFDAYITAAGGVVTLLEAFPTEPRFIIRHIIDGSPPDSDEIPVPALTVSVGSPIPLAPYELGSQLKWRSRHLMIAGFVRSRDELRLFTDWLAIWWDEGTQVDVLDHDAGTQAVVGSVDVRDATTRGFSIIERTEATRFEVISNARLLYVA